MGYDRTVRIPAGEAAQALVTSTLLDGHAARAHARAIALGEPAADGLKRAAFGSADRMIGLAIRDRIAYSERSGDLYVRPQLLEDAIATLAAIASAAAGEASRFNAGLDARRQRGEEVAIADLERSAAIGSLEQDACVLLALASGARILALAAESGCAA